MSASDRPLYQVFPGGKALYATYKGKDYKARVGSTGRVRYNGVYYDTPSAAGSAVRKGKATNGWWLWKYKDKKGNIVRLREIRK